MVTDAYKTGELWWYYKQTLKIWEQTEWKQGSYGNLQFSDFSLEGAISKGSGHWCI